ncbi:DUF2326 domain-containing protein [Brucella pituitosa]|uniref:DUF2326 domain-containing protein n=1 Tax=Brucella pituitosa TaxID=571256 RepID=UPI00200565AB|nr:DUF2326 domain-containing protein [Brucella pituitosa]MCK4205966.1 DUF2326 domain-containing protein [Brucella pituitosa]
MITEIYSDLKTFKTLTFNPGLNILVANRHETSGARDTRNGTGKTSMIELLHFIVQDRKNPDDDFHKNELIGHRFGANFKQDDSVTAIVRKSNPGKEKDEAFLNGNAIEFKDLRKNLGLEWFNLKEDDSNGLYTPKFGALFSFFVRKARNGAFNSPILNSSDQNAWDSQINLAYLLGFDWRLIQKLQSLKDQKKKADSLASMVKDGYFSDGALDLNKMQSRLDILEGEIERKRGELVSTKVLEGYRDHELAANALTSQIRDLNEANLQDLDLIESIAAGLEEVHDARLADIKALYGQVGIYFSDQVRKRFDEVEEFHRTLTENRQKQLGEERRRAEQRVRDRRQAIDRLQVALSEKLALLGSGIALDRLIRLEAELLGLETEMADLKRQIPRLRDVTDEQKKLKRDIAEQVDLIGQDVNEREEARKFAVQAFAEVSRYLYDVPGNLILGRSKGVSGLEIDTDIVGKKSGGKSHMQIFCFDWVLAEAARKQEKFPGFLVHDSHIFDGVDGRQIGLALSFAQKKCDQLGVQYIVAMNSDDLDKIRREEEASSEKIFDPTPYVMETHLSDDETGGLFGIRF